MYSDAIKKIFYWGFSWGILRLFFSMNILMFKDRLKCDISRPVKLIMTCTVKFALGRVGGIQKSSI